MERATGSSGSSFITIGPMRAPVRQDPFIGKLGVGTQGRGQPGGRHGQGAGVRVVWYLEEAVFPRSLRLIRNDRKETGKE